MTPWNWRAFWRGWTRGVLLGYLVAAAVVVGWLLATWAAAEPIPGPHPWLRMAAYTGCGRHIEVVGEGTPPEADLATIAQQAACGMAWGVPDDLPVLVLLSRRVPGSTRWQGEPIWWTLVTACPERAP